MPRRGHLLTALAGRGFRRLYAVRLLGQFGDGVFQASLAGAVLFNPERQASAADIAAAFAIILLPYSLVAPFAGVFIDRWWRQRIIIVSNVLRAAAIILVAAEILAGVDGPWFYASALIVMSISRFFLTALSAALPHVVSADNLVTANSFSTTSGAIATTAGGAAAILVRLGVGNSNLAYATIALAAALPYLAAAATGTGFERQTLGPDELERAGRESARQILRGLIAGGRHIRDRPAVTYALAAMAVHRLCLGLWTVCTVLLYRAYLHDDAVLRAGLAGLGQALAAVALGGSLAALITPVATRRLGYARWPALTLALAGVVEIAATLPYQLWTIVLAAFLLGFTSQGLKIAVDTLVQECVADEFRGRIFAIYDTLFNVALVAAAVVTALFLPADGRSPSLVMVLGATYLLTAGIYLRWASRVVDRSPQVTG